MTERVRIGKILTFSIDERVFITLENRFCLITGRNIQGMCFSRWMAAVPFVSRLSIFDSRRTNRVIPGLFTLSITVSMRNVQLHARDNHLCYALGSKRKISDMEAITSQGKPEQYCLTSCHLAELKCQKHLHLGRP